MAGSLSWEIDCNERKRSSSLVSSLFLRAKFDLFYIFFLTNSYCHLPFYLLCKSHHHYCNYVSLVGIIRSFSIKKDRRLCFFFYYYVCLPWLLWNRFVWRKHTTGRQGIVCAQTSPGWATTRLVSTPLPSILGPITAEGSPAQCTIYKKGPYIKLATLLRCWGTYRDKSPRG